MEGGRRPQAGGMSGEEYCVRVTLVRCKSSGRVLFLEAAKDFVDILVSILFLPAGTVITLLSEDGKVKNMGGISNIFESVEKLEDSLLYLDKATLTNPKPAMGFRRPGLLRIESNPVSARLQYYGCPLFCGYISTTSNMCCPSPSCGQRVLGRALSIVEASVAESKDEKTKSKVGYVKKNITYIITDNLQITPNSTIKSINILNDMKIEKMSELVCTDLSVTKTQVLRLLQAALTSNSALNDVFGK